MQANKQTIDSNGNLARSSCQSPPGYSSNDKFYLTDEKRQNLRLMDQNISRVFGKFGVQYWLDYG